MQLFTHNLHHKAVSQKKNYLGLEVSPCCVAIASHVDVLRGSSSVPVPLTSVDSSSKKRRPITAHFQLWVVHFGP